MPRIEDLFATFFVGEDVYADRPNIRGSAYLGRSAPIGNPDFFLGGFGNKKTTPKELKYAKRQKHCIRKKRKH